MSRSFDGVDDSISLANESNFDFERTNSFSFFFWAKDISATPSVIYTYFSKCVNNVPVAGSARGFMFFVRGDIANDPYEIQISSNSNGGVNILQARYTRTASTNFKSIAVTYDGTSTVSGVKCYENGILLSPTTIFNSLNDTILNNSNLELGSRFAGTQLFFNGLMAHFCCYSRVISLGEILQLTFLTGSITNGLKSFTPLWGTSSPEPDYSGKGNHGTVTGAIKGTTDPPINGIFRVHKPELITSF